MSRNYGLGSRDMAKAASFACKAAAARGEMSFSTAATVADRFSVFAEWSIANGDKYMEYVSREDVIAYGRELATQVERGEMSAAYAQNLVSAVNTVMSLATGGAWESVSPTRECEIEQRSTTRDGAPGGLDREAYAVAVDAVRADVGERAAAVVELCRELGLRSKEASLLNAREALQEALSRGSVTISEGTKGGRTREVDISSPRALEALERASSIQGKDRSLVPADQSWKEWREDTLRDAREIVQEHTGGGLHDLRAAWACERFEELTCHAAPVAGGYLDREADREAMRELAAELGHGRVDILSEYIGR